MWGLQWGFKKSWTTSTHCNIQHFSLRQKQLQSSSSISFCQCSCRYWATTNPIQLQIGVSPRWRRSHCLSAASLSVYIQANIEWKNVVQKPTLSHKPTVSQERTHAKFELFGWAWASCGDDYNPVWCYPSEFICWTGVHSLPCYIGFHPCQSSVEEGTNCWHNHTIDGIRICINIQTGHHHL